MPGNGVKVCAGSMRTRQWQSEVYHHLSWGRSWSCQEGGDLGPGVRVLLATSRGGRVEGRGWCWLRPC